MQHCVIYLKVSDTIFQFIILVFTQTYVSQTISKFEINVFAPQITLFLNIYQPVKHIIYLLKIRNYVNRI